MGGTSCRYYSSDPNYSRCPPNNVNGTVLNVGAIIGIIIGSLVGIVIIVLGVVIIYKLLRSRKNNSSSNQRHMNVYGLPMNMNNRHQNLERSEMYTPSKFPTFYEGPTYVNHEENV